MAVFRDSLQRNEVLSYSTDRRLGVAGDLGVIQHRTVAHRGNLKKPAERRYISGQRFSRYLFFQIIADVCAQVLTNALVISHFMDSRLGALEAVATAEAEKHRLRIG